MTVPDSQLTVPVKATGFTLLSKPIKSGVKNLERRLGLFLDFFRFNQEKDMLFLLRIDVSIPADMPQADKDKLRERENARAAELIAEGTMQGIWRIVGRIANKSLWKADTLEILHDKVSSMPMFPYMKIDVTPLINHPMTEIANAKQRAG